MKKLVYFSAIYLLLLSCKKNESTITTPVAVDSLDTSKTYLALGDSYTIGQSVASDESYPQQTVNLLRQENIQIKDPDIIAVTGWTTADLINAIDANPPKKNYSLVSLLIGVNNQYQHRSLEEYTIQFSALLDSAIIYAGNNINHVFVISIPDYSVTPFAANLDTAFISEQIDSFNLVNKTIALHAGVHYLDITPISKEAKNNAALTAGDGLHPSAYQYQQWSTLLATQMLAQLH